MISLAQSEAVLESICPLGVGPLVTSGAGHLALGMPGTPPLHGGSEAMDWGPVEGLSI